MGISKFKILILFFFITCFTQEALASYIRINDLRFSAQPNNKIRLVFDANGPIQYSIQEQPQKIVINIKNAKLIGLLNKTWLHKTPVSSVQNKQLGKDLCLILNLKKAVKLQHFVLIKPYRLVLDLFVTKSISDTSIKSQQVVANASTAAHAHSTPTTTVVLADQSLASSSRKKIGNKNLRDVMVVIDPGHGGKDPGAIGRKGTLEKDVALAVAKVLQNTINKTKGFRAILTRNRDYFVTLRERLDIAHHRKADMFIAIHADAYKDSSSHGVSIFALSQKGATSEAARWLAEKENASELRHTLADKNVQLKSVLLDLAQTATISASLEIGAMLLRGLASITHLHSHRVEQAAFVVLKAPDIPSLLVETGFISDPREEKRLCNAKYQGKIAASLAKGITTYFQHKPPQGTYLAKIKHGQ